MQVSVCLFVCLFVLRLNVPVNNISSPEPKAHKVSLSDGHAPSGRRQRSSPLKLLGQSKPNFVEGGTKAYIKGPGRTTEMAAMAINSKNLLKHLLL